MSAQPTLFAANDPWPEPQPGDGPDYHAEHAYWREAKRKREAESAAEPHTLTPRQEAAWDLVRSTPGGVTAEQVGANQHERRGKHPADERCEWCASEGLGILRSVALRPLVIRRRRSCRRLHNLAFAHHGQWEPRNPRDAVRPSVPRREPTETELQRNPFAGLEL